jgi:class 3 adenylate cyclase/tetratricopeptide (TPR) repeat protein
VIGCGACGHESRPGRRFCGACGSALVITCPSCEFTNEADEAFCGGCGQRLAVTGPGAGAVAPPRTAAPEPQSYTPRHLAEKILAGRDALAGERKHVTVLFADVVDSTELIRGRDAEEAQALLDGVVRVMMEAVHRFEGTVSRLMGDGLMALFGAPIAHEDHAVRACYAALAMLEAARGYAEEVREAYGAAVAIRVGINSGEVVVRLISDDLHMDYTAMGPTVHLAARMEGLASADTALLTPSTLPLIEGFVEVRPLGPTPVKGVAEPIETFELVGAGAARTRLQASATRGLTPFVGRRDERAAIDRALERAGAGHGQVVVLVAEAGVGKSRLVWELTHAEQARGSTVLQAGALSYGQTTAWLPVIDVLRSYFHIEGRDDHAGMRDKVTAGVRALDPALEPRLPALLALLDVPVEDATWAQLDPSLRRRATLDAVRQLLLRESQRRPLLLIFEDLHWIDSETQALLDGLVESLPTAHILLLVNYRPEYTHPWGNKSYYTQIRIDPLGEQSAQELLDALLGPDSSIRPLMALLIRRAEGTPLFLEEGVRSLVETGALVSERGAYRLTRPVDEIRVPATVQAVLAARIDRLPAEEKRLLQTAAVIGKDVPYPLLQAIADLPDDRLQRGLVRLQAAEFLYEAALFPELGYTFKHALTHEVTYGSLLNERRRELHARIVDAIEALYPDRLIEHVEHLAYHAVRGEAWQKGVAYCRLAGKKAADRSAYREAAAWFRQGLSALHHLPELRGTLELAIDLRLELRHALLTFADPSEVLEVLQEAEIRAQTLGDRHRLARVSAYLSNPFWHRGDHDRAIEQGQRAVALAEELGDAELEILAQYYLAAPYADRGDHHRTVQGYRRVVAALRDDPFHRFPGQVGYPAVQARAFLAWSLSELGDFAEGAARGEEAVCLAESGDRPYSLALACFYLGGLYLRQGRSTESIASLERGLRLCETWELARPYLTLAAGLGAAYTLAGRVADSLPLLEQGEDHAASQGRAIDSSMRAGWLSDSYLAADRPEDAAHLAQRALDLAVSRKERGYEAWALQFLGKISSHREPPEVKQAERHYREALVLAEELGMRPLQAHCHLGLGKLYRRLGRAEEARAELSTAITMLREMGMMFWLPEAKSELAQADASA